jgi:hypothetical protein
MPICFPPYPALALVGEYMKRLGEAREFKGRPCDL